MDWKEVDISDSTFISALTKQCGNIQSDIEKTFQNNISKITIVPDDYSDPQTGKERKAKCIQSFMISDTINATKIRVHFGSKYDVKKVKYIFWIFVKLIDRFANDLGLQRKEPLDVYLSGTGLDPCPCDLPKGIGGRQWCGCLTIACDDIKVLAHELSHIFMEPVMDRSNGFEESLADFFSNLYLPNDGDLYNNLLSVNCQMSRRNIVSHTMFSYGDGGRPYDLEPFWYFVVNQIGLKAFIKMIFFDKVFQTQQSVQNVWQTLANYLKTTTDALVTQYVVDTIACSYFRDDGPRFKNAKKRLSSYYGSNLIWTQFNILKDYVFDKSTNGFTSKAGLEVYSFEAHSIPLLFSNTQSLDSCKNISVCKQNKDDRFKLLLLKRDSGKAYISISEDSSTFMTLSPEEVLLKKTEIPNQKLMFFVIRLGGTTPIAKYQLQLS